MSIKRERERQGKRNSAWLVSIVVGLGAGACGGAHPQSPLESPLGAIQAPGTPQTVVRISDAFSQQLWIQDVEIVGNDLYVTVPWSGVYRLPKFGGSIGAIDEDSHVRFDELAAGDGAVFWEAATFDANDYPTTRVRRATAGDDTASTIYQAALGYYGSTDSRNLQVDASVVYLTEISNQTEDGAVHRIPAGGGAELASILPFNVSPPYPPPIPTWIARNGGVVDIECAGVGSCTLQRVTVGGTQPIASLAVDRAWVRGADDAAAYVVTESGVPAGAPAGAAPNPLASVDLQSGAVTELVSDCQGGRELLTDEHEIYFIAGATTIDAVAKLGGARRTVADLTGSHGIWRLAQDDTHLFALTANGEVVAIPKHPSASP